MGKLEEHLNKARKNGLTPSFIKYTHFVLIFEGI